MNKLVSLGLLAVSLSFFAAPVFAGNVEDCETIKFDDAYKSLYGLCTAYWNADDEEARLNILSNYNRRAEKLGAPPMPGLLDCPCWDATRLQRDACAYDVDPVQPPGIVFLANMSVQYINFGDSCLYANFSISPTEFSDSALAPGEAELCQAGMSLLLSGDLLDGCD